MLVHTEVDVRSKAHAEHVRWHFNSFDHWRASTIEEHDLERRQNIRIGEQIPSLAARTGVVRVRQVRRGDDAVLVAVRVIDRNLGRRSLSVDHQLGRSHQQFGIGFEFHRNDQELGPNVDRLLILGFVAWTSLLFAEGRLGNRSSCRDRTGVGTGQQVAVADAEERGRS